MEVKEEFKNLIPALSVEEYAQLEANILEEGIREPIITWNGYIIDGHNRFSIAQRFDLEYKTTSKYFANEESVKEWMILNQFGRRNLSNYQRSVLALELEEVFSKKAKEKELERKTTFAKSQKSSMETINTNKELSNISGIGQQTIARVKKIQAKAPQELKAKLATGEVSINAAYKEIRKKENIERREKIKDQFSEAPQLQSKKTYRVIYADPPWLYDKGKELSDSYGDVSKHYPPMELQDICDLPVSELCDKNSVLFLWATAPKLPEALEVMKAWGFEYKTNVIWDKVGHNFGYYFSVRHEILLIGGKGSSTPDNRKLHDSVISIEKSKKHSEKPQYFKELINTLYTEGNKIELFCRESSLNFDAWGNEINTI